MKKNSGKQAVINFIGQHPGCSFQDIRRGTGLDSSVVNSSLWQMHRDGQVKRVGECRSYRYTLIDTTAVNDSDPSVQYRQRPGGSKKMNIETVNELIASLESAGELSIREQKFLKLAKEFRICSASLDAAIKTGNVLADQNAQLAAENVALKDINAWCKTDAFKNMYREFKTAESLGCSDVDCMHDAMLVAIMHAPETPATDRIMAEAEARGVEKAIVHLEKKFSNIGVQIMNLQWLADSLREGAK